MAAYVVVSIWQSVGGSVVPRAIWMQRVEMR
jgi:hypothetical protein